jgi:hypothetical protein
MLTMKLSGMDDGILKFGLASPAAGKDTSEGELTASSAND